MTEDSIDIKLHKAKVKIEVVAANLADIGLEGISTRLRAIVKELDDIEKPSTCNLERWQGRRKNERTQV